MIYDSSTIENPFVLALYSDSNVKMFFKTPYHFKINAPIRTYNPDWVVLLKKHLYNLNDK